MYFRSTQIYNQIFKNEACNKESDMFNFNIESLQTAYLSAVNVDVTK